MNRRTSDQTSSEATGSPRGSHSPINTRTAKPRPSERTGLFFGLQLRNVYSPRVTSGGGETA